MSHVHHSLPGDVFFIQVTDHGNNDSWYLGPLTERSAHALAALNTRPATGLSSATSAQVLRAEVGQFQIVGA